MKDNRGIATKTDVMLLILAACVCILGCAAWCEWTSVTPLFAAMVGVLVYFSVLAALLSYRRKRPLRQDIAVGQGFGGTDVSEFIARLPHPTVLCDEDDLVLWCNDAFLSASGADSLQLGSNIFEVCVPIGREALAVSDEAVVSLNGRLYHYDKVPSPVDPSVRMLILREVTELNELCRRCSEEQTAVAYVVVDNVEDLLQYIQDKFRSAVSEVEVILREWVKSMNGVIRSYERDKYILFFDNRHLEECIQNRFSILDSIRNVRVGDSMPVTVSVGVSCATGTLFEREQWAQAALDMALQRGGDQVVCRNDDGTAYYGGKTKAIYKRANVRARAIGTQIVELLGRADNVLIMGHGFGDYDSFGSAVGMACLARYFGLRTNIVCNRSDYNLRPCFDKIAECREYDDVFVGTEDAVQLLTDKTLLIVVDVNNVSNMACPKLYELSKNTVIIDHHTQTNVFSIAPLIAYIEPSASSASEMVAEILEQHLAAKQLLPQEAELMLSGILLDTKQFTRNTGTRTFGAALFLRGEGANPGEANEFFKTDVADIEKQSQFLGEVVVYKERLAIAVCEGETDASYRVIAAKVADRLLSVRGINASFALVNINGRIFISARSDGTVNVAKILEEMNGGGHFDSAGAQVEGAGGDETVRRLKEAIDKYVD